MDAVATPVKHKLFAAGLIGLFALNLYLYSPLFGTEPPPYKGSIAAGYAGMTRFIAEHPDPWGWNPQQYAGQPTQFTYPPFLPYTAASIHWLTGMEPAHAYRSLVGFLVCLGPAAVAFAYFYFTGSPVWALILGLAYSVFSPVYGLFAQIDSDRGLFYLPWRILVLLKYGEGPHVTGLTLLPIILVALRWGLARKDFFSLFVMALAFAIAPLTNWIVAFSLAICALLMALSDWSGTRRLILAALFGYGLSAFWLTPDYVQTTLLNWPKDAYGYRVDDKTSVLQIGLLAVVLILAAMFRYYRAAFSLRFHTLATTTFFTIAAGFYFLNLDVIPESRRYVLEFELFLFLAAFEWLRRGYQSIEAIDKICAIAVSVFMLATGATQASKSFARHPSDWATSRAEQTLEYPLAQWLQTQHPQGRIFASGGFRFRLNSWVPLHQVSGSFESGLRNRIAPDYFYQVRTDEGSKPGEATDDAIRQLTAIGTEYIVVHDAGSEEYYKDIKTPAKFFAMGPVVHSPTPHDRVHKLPFRSLAHIVNPDELPKSKYKEDLRRYHMALTDLGRPLLTVEERNPSHWRIRGTFPQGKLITFAMNWDPGWRAVQSGQPIEAKPNQLGMITLTPKASDSGVIDLEFNGTTQQKLFSFLSLSLWIVSIGLCIRSRSWQASTSTPSS